MRAAWYDRTGPAGEVLDVGELPDPTPGSDEVRVRVAAAGVNPRDVKRRAGSGDRVMTDPRVIPGDDGAGVIDAVGRNVTDARLGERVWVHSANAGRAFGTAAEWVVVDAEQAIALPDGVAFEVGACLGVPALTAHRCLYADGPIAGQTVLVTGGAGAVGHYTIELARSGGATVIATASTTAKQAAACAAGADHILDYRAARVSDTILQMTGGRGVYRVVDVAFGANLALTSAVIATNGVIATYGSDAMPEPRIPFYPLMRRGVTVRMVLVFIMPDAARRAAVADITRLLASNALTHPIAAEYPLAAIADAHAAVEAGPIGKVLLQPQE